MTSDTLIFAAIFMIAIAVTCGGVVMMAFSRLTGSSIPARKRKATLRHSSSHRLHKGVL